MFTLTPLDFNAADWPARVEQMRRDLGAPHNPTLFPLHFLQTTLPKLGGSFWRIQECDQLCGYALLFPRLSALPTEPSSTELSLTKPSLTEPSSTELPSTEFSQGSAARAPLFTMRYHARNGAALPRGEALAEQMTQRLRSSWGEQVHVIAYSATDDNRFAPSHHALGDIDMGAPNAVEARAARALQAEIWGGQEDDLYPFDLYSESFGPGTGLVARMEGEVAAFLFGFTKFGGRPLPSDWSTRLSGAVRLESQTLGVLPRFRGYRIAYLLKRAQGNESLRRGVPIINWTADPLQWPNAALNFGMLHAIAFDFHANYYPFRNALNRVPASRLSLTWLPGSKRVRSQPLVGARSQIVHLEMQPRVLRVNRGLTVQSWRADVPTIAIEIPADWNALQQNEPDAAQRWRATTDELFAHYIGIKKGQYAITGVARDGEQRFLLAERASERLWRRLAA